MKQSRLRQAFLERLSDADQLLSLFDLLPDVSFFMKDRQGKFIALNRRGCQYCGVTAERDAIGKTDRDFFPTARAEDYMADDRAVMESGKPILNRVEPAPELGGSTRLVVTSKIPLRNGKGRVIGVAGFSRQVEQVRRTPTVQHKLARAIDHLHKQPHAVLSSGELARMAGLSVSQFERTFRKAFGTSPRQYLLRVRVEAACKLLAETDDPIASVAVECGFYDHAHFTRSFQSVMSVSPSRYRQEQQAPGLKS